jgi:ABC-2 type transport system permease protein
VTPFSATVRSEWTKLTALRSTRIALALAVVLAVIPSAGLALVIGMTWDRWDAPSQAEFEPIGTALVGGILSAIFFLVIGARCVTAEYASGMMRITLTATPRRGRVLAAKALVVGAIAVAGGLVTSLGMFLVTQAIFDSYGLESASLGDADALRAVLVGSALSFQFPVITLALGFLLRSTAGAVVGILAVLLAPPFLSGLLPAWWGDGIFDYLPGAASDALTIGHLEGAGGGLAPAAAGAVTLAWTAVFIAAAWVALERRDA